MNTKIITLIAGAALALGFSACDDNWVPKLDNEGTLRLSSVDVDVQHAENVVSRADIDVDGFTVKLSQNGREVEKYTYSQMPDVVTLPVGDYDIEVYSHEVQPAAWEAPYYYGSKAFSIADMKITDIGSIVCKFANLRVSVYYTARLQAAMADDCKVTVVSNDFGNLEYTPAEKRSGYFKVLEGGTTMVATFEGTVDGVAVTVQRTFDDVKPGNHYKITYDIKAGPEPDIPEIMGILEIEGPNGGIVVDNDMNVTNEDVNVNIGGEDVIGPNTGEEEDPQNPPTGGSITFTSSTLVFAPATNNVAPGEAVVNIHSDNGFAHLNVKIESNNAAFIASAGELMPLQFDLVNTGDYREAFSGIGFLVDEQYDGINDAPFVITELVPLLAAFPGTHTFSLTVVDKEGNSNSTSLIFIAQ